MKLGEKLKDVLYFTYPTPLSGIWIGGYIECYFLVHIISFMHHASSWVRRKISKVRKVSSKGKILYFNRLQTYCNQLHKLFEAYRVMSHIGLIGYNLIVIDYIVVFEIMSDLFRSLCFNRLPCNINYYFSFSTCFRSEQEHFNRLLWVSNRLHCPWAISRFWEEHFNQ